MSRSKINSVILGHANIFHKGPWKNDEYSRDSYRESINADLDSHNDNMKNAFKNILAFLKSADSRGRTECREICKDILNGDENNINAHLMLYDINTSAYEKEQIIERVRDIMTSRERDHCIGVALLELGVALYLLIPSYYQTEREEGFDEKLADFFEGFDCLQFVASDDIGEDISNRERVDDSGIYNYEAKEIYRTYTSMIYHKEGLKRLRNSLTLSNDDQRMGVYKYSLAKATNRLSHLLMTWEGAFDQYEYYQDASIKGLCEVVGTLDHNTHEFYVRRCYAYLGLLIQKRKTAFQRSGNETPMPESFKQLADLEVIWKEPEEAYKIALKKFDKDIVVYTRYGKFLDNIGRSKEAIEELKKTENLTSSEKWFPNHIKMNAYYHLYVSERKEKKGGRSSNTDELLENILKYGKVCMKGHTPMNTLYLYAKALYWSGTRFIRNQYVVTDKEKLETALDVIRMIYEGYRDQNLAKTYKLHAECCQRLGNLNESLQYMVFSFNASSRSDSKVSLHYLCLFGLMFCNSTTDDSNKRLALRHVKHAIEDEVRYCLHVLRNSEERCENMAIRHKLASEDVCDEVFEELKNNSLPLFDRILSIYEEIDKMSRKYPEEMMLLLEYTEQIFITCDGTKTMKAMILNCNSNIYLVRPATRADIGDNDMFFRPLNVSSKGNETSVNKTSKYDFCVIHFEEDQDWVACCLKTELEDGPERFKGCIFERDAPIGEDTEAFVEQALMNSKRILVVCSTTFLHHMEVRRLRCLTKLQQLQSKIICIMLETVQIPTSLQWLCGSLFDASTRPVHWKKLRTLLLQEDCLPDVSKIRLELPSYPMNSKTRGLAVIINNICFENMSSRCFGAAADGKKLKSLWDSLGFESKVNVNLTKSEMEILLRDTAGKDHSEFNCLVVCIMSHGDLGKVFGTDGQSLDIEEFVSYFYSTNCPSLADKPKLFFIQACRGSNVRKGHQMDTDGASDDEETDGPQKRAEIVHDEADILIAYSTTPGSVSTRGHDGSIYISELVKQMKTLTKEGHDLVSILIVVNEKVSKVNLNDGGRQIPQPTLTLTKRIIFL